MANQYKPYLISVIKAGETWSTYGVECIPADLELGLAIQKCVKQDTLHCEYTMYTRMLLPPATPIKQSAVLPTVRRFPTFGDVAATARQKPSDRLWTCLDGFFTQDDIRPPLKLNFRTKSMLGRLRTHVTTWNKCKFVANVVCLIPGVISEGMSCILTGCDYFNDCF